MQVPMRRAALTHGWSIGTVRTLPETSSSGTGMQSSPLTATMTLYLWAATSSPATAPRRVHRRRSVGVGVPPRWMCPSCVIRASIPVSCSSSRTIRLTFDSRIMSGCWGRAQELFEVPFAPLESPFFFLPFFFCGLSSSFSSTSSGSPIAVAPSATAMIEKRFPL